jgi:SpoVK/Ycf46/Vps4 family AAA+-type ATPase
MNIALLGEPGVGKTHLSEILAEIFASLSVTKNGDLVKISITDLVGQVVGQSENKTAEILKKHKGSVILVDEAYSIARSGDSRVCSFGAKSLDTINKFLGENTDTMMIICGYKELIDKYFFGVNDGLKRRFPWIFEMKGYNETELYQIMETKIAKDGYIISFTDEQKQNIIKMIKDNKETLKHNGGDIANIITKAISLHCRRILTMSKTEKNVLCYDTIINGMTNYFKKPEINIDEWKYSMYT